MRTEFLLKCSRYSEKGEENVSSWKLSEFTAKIDYWIKYLIFADNLSPALVGVSRHKGSIIASVRLGQLFWGSWIVVTVLEPIENWLSPKKELKQTKHRNVNRCFSYLVDYLWGGKVCCFWCAAWSSHLWICRKLPTEFIYMYLL